MPVLRRTIFTICLWIWLASLIFIGSTQFALTIALSVLLGFVSSFDFTQTNVIRRMVTGQLSEPIIFASMKAINPSDGHAVRESDDFIGTITRVTPLAGKEAKSAE
jgi:hypothetical protein